MSTEFLMGFHEWPIFLIFFWESPPVGNSSTHVRTKQTRFYPLSFSLSTCQLSAPMIFTIPGDQPLSTVPGPISFPKNRTHQEINLLHQMSITWAGSRLTSRFLPQILYLLAFLTLVNKPTCSYLCLRSVFSVLIWKYICQQWQSGGNRTCHVKFVRSHFDVGSNCRSGYRIIQPRCDCWCPPFS